MQSVGTLSPLLSKGQVYMCNYSHFIDEKVEFQRAEELRNLSDKLHFPVRDPDMKLVFTSVLMNGDQRW